MNGETLKALKASIRKWERNATAEHSENYHIESRYCPLCTLYLENDCVGCPVSGATGVPYCRGSPYLEAVTALALWDGAQTNKYRDMALKAALVEVEFLKGLLPEEAKL